MHSLFDAALATRRAAAFALAATVLVTGCTAHNDPDPGAPSSGISTPTTENTATAAPSGASSDAPEPPSEAPTQNLGPTGQPVLPTVQGATDEEIELSTGMVVSLISITATTVEAETPGDVAGEAVEVIVHIANTSPEVQNVDSAVVSLETADGELGVPTIAGGASPLAGDIEPTGSAEGRYLFMLDPVHDRDIIISVNYAAGEPVAEFTGRTS